MKALMGNPIVLEILGYNNVPRLKVNLNGLFVKEFHNQSTLMMLENFSRNISLCLYSSASNASRSIISASHSSVTSNRQPTHESHNSMSVGLD